MNEFENIRPRFVPRITEMRSDLIVHLEHVSFLYVIGRVFQKLGSILELRITAILVGAVALRGLPDLAESKRRASIPGKES